MMIITEVSDSDGNTVSLESKYEKIRDGKFNLKLAFDNNNNPGLYKIKTTFTMDGHDYVIEKEFAYSTFCFLICNYLNPNVVFLVNILYCYF